MTTFVERSAHTVAQELAGASAELASSNTDGIVVDRAILHLVDPQFELELSNRALDLKEMDGFREFLVGHIAAALHDPRTHSAKVVDEPTEESVAGDLILSSCESLLLDTAPLVATSQELARKLYTAINRDKRVKRGVLAVVVGNRGSDGAQALPLVALLKLDLGLVFRPEWRTDGHGMRYLCVSPVSNVMPAVGEGLQKAAFVQGTDRENEEHFQVLDRQTKPFLAEFFLTSFLHAQARWSDVELTYHLYGALVGARREIASDPAVAHDQLVLFDRVVAGVIAGAAFKRDALLAQVPAKARKATERAIRKAQVPDFTLDPTIVAKMTAKTRYIGDDGLIVEADTNSFDRMISVSNPDASDVRTVTIKTKQWEQQW